MTQYKKPPVCLECINLIKTNKKLSCKAFKDLIPFEIIKGENDHSKPLKGQKNNIVFEPIK
jgi:hypothetical protein